MIKKNILFAITMFLLLMVITGCAGPWKGKIIDMETKDPLEGTVVLAVWQRVYRTPAGDNSYFYEAKETVTDKEGKFEIPSYTPINLLPLFSYMRGPEFTIFKPGYGGLSNLALGGYLTGEKKDTQDFDLHEKRYRFALGTIELPKLKTRKERLEVISLPTSIPDDKMPKLIELMNKEAINLGLQPSHKHGDAK